MALNSLQRAAAVLLLSMVCCADVLGWAHSAVTG